MSQEAETLLTFPCDFPIKVTGKNTTDFAREVMEIMNRLIPENRRIHYSEQLSRNQNYLSITLTARFEDKAQIDGVYQALTQAKTVLMAL